MNNSEKYCLKNNNRITWLYVAGAVFFLVSFALGMMLGSARIPLKDIFNSVFSDTAQARILLYVRLPRVLATLFCGGALAVSGAVIQNVLGNRLASPGIIGVNAGAGLAVTLCCAFGIIGGFTLSFFSFAGAFLTALAVSIISKKWGASRGTVILLGVALNSLLGAVSDAVTTLVPEISVMKNDFKIGDFSAVTYEKLFPSAAMIFAALIVLSTLSNELELFCLGEETAKGLGMNTSLMRSVFLVLAALLAGCAVSVAGLLSFVGLIVPHIIRRLAGNRAFHLNVLSFLLGGAFVCICDTFARVLFTPYEIPVGIIMAFIGAPFFIFILIKGKGGHGNA